MRLDDQPGLQNHQATQRRRLPPACDAVAPRHQRPRNACAARHTNGPRQRVNVLGVVCRELEWSGRAMAGECDGGVEWSKRPVGLDCRLPPHLASSGDRVPLAHGQRVFAPLL